MQIKICQLAIIIHSPIIIKSHMLIKLTVSTPTLRSGDLFTKIVTNLMVIIYHIHIYSYEWEQLLAFHTFIYLTVTNFLVRWNAVLGSNLILYYIILYYIYIQLTIIIRGVKRTDQNKSNQSPHLNRPVNPWFGPSRDPIHLTYRLVRFFFKIFFIQ